jgi:hypothetical protein
MTEQSELEKFDAGVRRILSVSRDELKRREEQWQREREGKAKPGPKPKPSREQPESLLSILKASSAGLQRIAESYSAPRPTVPLERSLSQGQARKLPSLGRKRQRKSELQK